MSAILTTKYVVLRMIEFFQRLYFKQLLSCVVAFKKENPD